MTTPPGRGPACDDLALTLRSGTVAELGRLSSCAEGREYAQVTVFRSDVAITIERSDLANETDR